MASTSLDLFRALLPALCDEPDGRVNVFIEAAARRLHAPAWGAVYLDAVVYMAGHLLLKSPSPGADGDEGASGLEGGGPITSKKAGDLAVSFGSTAAGSKATSNTDADFAETHPGRQFLALRDTRAAGMPFFAGFGSG